MNYFERCQRFFLVAMLFSSLAIVACGPRTYAKPPASPKVEVKTETGADLGAEKAVDQPAKEAKTEMKKAVSSRPTAEPLTKAPTVDYSDSKVQRQGGRLFRKLGCALCHKTSGVELGMGPNLSGISGRLSRGEIRVWVRNPKAKKPKTTMPDFEGSTEDLEAILAFLSSL
ncbi:MAG: cytochrome c [Planctomycetota bacterium]